MNGLGEYMIAKNLPFKVMWETEIAGHQLAWVLAPWRDEQLELGYGLLLCQCDLTDDTSLDVDFFGLSSKPECYFKQVARSLRRAELQHQFRGTLSFQEIREPARLQGIIAALYDMWRRGEFLGEHNYDEISPDAVLLCQILGLPEFEDYSGNDYDELTRHIIAYKLTLGRDEPLSSSFWSEEVRYSTVPMRP